KLIQKIDEGLILIDRGDYGFCNECGIEIGYDRMVARPTATMCIDCKTASEIKERHTGSFMAEEE
ncbi:RNA polymerase-binding protein DksA, partial [bacterium]|nr:RNA polymerase-binding protein DksA [bacterium]